MTTVPPHRHAACPDAGTWRAWLDGEQTTSTKGRATSTLGVEPLPADLASHLASCPVCRAETESLREDQQFSAQALDLLAPAAPLSAAATELALRQTLWRAQHGEPVTTPPTPAATQPRPMLLTRKGHQPVTLSLASARYAWGGLAAALALSVALVLTPGGQAAAAQFLAQFRSQRFTVVTVNPQEMRRPLAHLENLGTVTGPRGAGEMATVSSLAEASSRVGFTVKAVDPATLPAATDRTPTIRVMPAGEHRFRFERARAQAYFQSIGQPNVQLPARFDGAVLVVSQPAAVLQQFRGNAGGSTIVVGQAGELQVGVEGNVTLDEMRDFLLGLPGLPADTVRQIRAIQDWRTTVPIPVPLDQVSWRPASVNGTEALVLSETGGVGSGVIWQKDGQVHGVAGTLKQDEVLRVASGLR